MIFLLINWNRRSPNSVYYSSLHLIHKSLQEKLEYSCDSLNKFNEKYCLVSHINLYGAGKFPTLVSHQESLESKVNEIKATVKFQLKKVLCMGVAVGNLSMEEKQIFQNVQMSVNFLVSLLKKNWQNVSFHVTFKSFSYDIFTPSSFTYIFPPCDGISGEVLVLEEYHGKATTHLLRSLQTFDI